MEDAEEGGVGDHHSDADVSDQSEAEVEEGMEEELHTGNEALLMRAEAMDRLGIGAGKAAPEDKVEVGEVEEAAGVAEAAELGAAAGDEDMAGGAASSGDAVPMPKAAVAAKAKTRAVGVRGPTVAAAATLTLANGRIAYYANKQMFEAVCNNKAHGHCVMSRTSKGRKGGTVVVGSQ